MNDYESVWLAEYRQWWAGKKERDSMTPDETALMDAMRKQRETAEAWCAASELAEQTEHEANEAYEAMTEARRESEALIQAYMKG